MNAENFNNNNAEPKDIQPYFALMRGILNDKYIVSAYDLTGRGVKRSNIPGLTLLGNYSDVPGSSGYGTYIYQNDEYLPRYYVANKAILLYGGRESSTAALYTLITGGYFDPHKAIIVLGNDLTPDQISKFDLVILTDDSYKQHLNDLVAIASKYPSKFYPGSYYGNATLPQVIKSLNGSITPVDVVSYTPNKVVLKIPAGIESGHLVMSEKFYMFDGWTAKIGGKAYDLVDTYDVISSLYFDSPGEVVLSYLPRSVLIGGFVSLAAVALCLLLIFLVPMSLLNIRR